MNRYDIFNGDADGICALIQLRLANPCESELVTGVKRDIQLLEKITANENDEITILDISLDKNRKALENCLDTGANVTWFDHHYAGEIPAHKNLNTFINTDADVCTSFLVDQYLNSRYKAWAVTAAFGDNLYESANRNARELNLSNKELESLKNLGTYMNYNGYGSNINELYFHPAKLYSLMAPYANPLEFIANERVIFEKLEFAYQDDISKANNILPEFYSESHGVFILPDEPWARRVSGVYSNMLTQNNPNRAHAVLTLKPNNNFLVSIRAPLNNKTGADELARQFPTGGGRKAAAGINDLPNQELDAFLITFKTHFK